MSEPFYRYWIGTADLGTCHVCRQTMSAVRRTVHRSIGQYRHQHPAYDSDLEVNADNSEVTETELTFVGNVRVQQGYRRVSANQVTIDRAGERAVASGDVTFREPGVVITGDSVIYDSISEVAQVNAAQYLLHNRQLGHRSNAFPRCQR